LKHWQNVAVAGGFLTVLALVVERLLRTGTPSAGFWSKADFWSHLIPVGLSEVAVALLLLAILWVGNSFWREVRRKSGGNRLGGPRDLFARRWGILTELALLASILGRAAGSLPGIRTPGTLVRHVIFKLDVFSLTGAWVTLALHFMIPIVVNAAVCFGVLCGGYLLWRKARGKDARRNLEVEK
jgi:hypothetical protein